MDIHFCSRCNQSIPLADLESGEAVRRDGRLLCTTCRYLHERPVPRRSRSWLLPLVGLAILVVACLSAIGMRLVDKASFLQRIPVRARGPDNEALLARLALLEQRVRQSMDRLQHDVQTGSEVREQDLTRRLSDHAAALAQLAAAVKSLEARPAPQPVINPQDLAKLKADVSGILYEVEFLRDGLENRGGAPARKTRRKGQPPRAAEKPPEAPAAAAAPEPVKAEKPDEPATASSIMKHWFDRLEAKNPSSRLEAIEGLTAFRGSRVTQALIGRLRDWSAAVRQRAAEDLGDRRAEEARAGLVKLLEDNDPTVREAAVGALRSITGRCFGFESKAPERQRTRAAGQWQRFVKALDRKEKG